MKRDKYLWLLLLVCFAGAVFSCSDDDEVTGPLTIETGLLKEISYTSALCGGEISGGNAVGARGVCWSVSSQPTIEDQHTKDGSGRGEFRSELTGLTEGIQYYVRAYVEAEGGIYYGDEKTCVTLAHGKPTLLMTGISEIQETSAVVSAQVFTDGGTEITERGFVYRLQSAGDDEPTLENASQVKVEGTTGLMKQLIEGLTDNENYVCRAYVTYPEGTIYTRIMDFKTLVYPAPEMEMDEVTDVTNESFQVTVRVAAGSPLPVKEYGVVWGTKTLPTIDDQHKKIGEGEGESNVTIDGLEEGVVYYVRPYAMNKNGTFYGKEESVATLGYKAAIATRMTTYITAHRAYAGGEIINFGVMNAPVTEAGICWGTNEHPTIGDHKVSAEGIGNEHPEFDSLMIFPLKPQTKYYLRAYVTNEYGTNYGEEYSFTTREPVANYFKAEGSNSDNPVFNGLNLTPTYPGGMASDDQLDAYEKLEKIMSDYGGRSLAAYRIYLTPDEKQVNTYIYTTIQYTNSAGKAYVGIWRDKLDINADYVYQVSHHAISGGNAENIQKSAVKNGQEEDLNRSINYLPDSAPFVIDWDNESTDTFGSAFYIIPVNHPEQFKRMGVFRYTSLTAATDWW